MNTGTENASALKDARKSNSKSAKRKKELTCFSTSKIVPLNLTMTYSLTSTRSNIQRNINWHESEWPHLPRPAMTVSQCGLRFQEKELIQSGSSSSLHDILSKESNNTSDNTELLVPWESCLKKDCLDEKSIACTTREVEAITSSLTALEMSKKCYQWSAVKKLEHLPSHCLAKTQSQDQKKERQTNCTSVQNNSTLKLNQGALLINEQEEKASLCNDDFPDLTKKNMKKVKTTFFPYVQDNTSKKVTKKYPKRNDPIFINIGEVLEHSSSSENCKSLLRNRHCKGFWSGNACMERPTSRPVIRRGKQREFPKRKTPTKLKLTILRDRQHRQQIRLLTNSLNQSSRPPNRCLQAGTSGDDLTSLCSEGQTSPQGEIFNGLKSFDVSCSSTPFDPVDIRSHSDILDIDNVVLSFEEKEDYGSKSSLSPSSERSLVYYADEVLQLAKSSIHSRKFREYCNNDRCVALEDKVKSFVTQIYRFQTKSHFRDADKARIHRRYVLGLREADKYFKLRKLKVLIIATDLEANSEKGGLDEIIENMKSKGRKENLPVIFALKRRDLAYCVYRKCPVSCVAVLNYQGAEVLFRAMVDAWKEASAAYDERLREALITSSKQVSDSNGKIGDITDSAQAAITRVPFLIEDHHEEGSTSTRNDQSCSQDPNKI